MECGSSLRFCLKFRKIQMTERQEFTKLEELIFADLDASKTTDLIEKIERYGQAAKLQLKDESSPIAKGGLAAVLATVVILRAIWERAHNRNFPE
jgi:hypothetical protein